MSIAAYPRYKSYKAARVAWVDEIPYKWEILRIQDFATFNDDVVNEQAYRNRQIRYVDISGVDAVSNTYTFEEQEFQQAPSRARRIAIAGDTVFSTVRPYLKAVATINIPEEDLVFSTGFAVVRPKKNADSRFVGYLLRNDRFISEVSARSVGASYPAINASELMKLHAPLPSLSEQRTIAAFLDEKCAKIDEALRIKEDQIKLLHERRQILIQQAVTRGLNPDAPMKNSGIDWIGQIPQHWKVQRNFTLFREIKKAGNADLPVLSVSIHSGVSREELSEAENIRSVIKIEDRAAYKEVLPGDIAYNMMRAWQGGIGAVHTHGMVSPAYVVARPIVTMVADYFERLYRTPAFINQMDANSKGITDFRKRLYWDNFRDLLTVVPPKTEQQQINQYAEHISHKVDKAISIKKNQITTLKEYKTTLINAVVTGKIKITEAML